MPPDFDPNFEIPRWGWWIVLYFFVGGITGGVYFAAAWLDLFGDAKDRPAMRLGHLIAFPLIVVSGLLLIVDLGQPLRFWHMIFESERFPVPILKLYSPISLGSAILALFGLVSFISFVDATFGRGPLAPFDWEQRRQSVVRARRGRRIGPLGVHGCAAERHQRASLGQQPVDWRAVSVLGRLDGHRAAPAACPTCSAHDGRKTLRSRQLHDGVRAGHADRVPR